MLKTILLVFFSIGMAYTQTPIGQIEATSFTRFQYGAGAQNWAITHDSVGHIFIANNEGLLVFDGTVWQLFSLPNRTILRSIAFGPGGRLYAGGQDELGYFAPDQVGRLQYVSIKNLLPLQERSFADVWDIEVVGKDVFYRTNEKIFQLSENKVSVFKSKSSWQSMKKFNGKLLAQDEENGLLIFQKGHWESMMANNRLPKNFIITGIIPFHEDTSLVSTTKMGFFLLTMSTIQKFPLNNPPEHQYFTSLAKSDENTFLAGSYSNGVYIINRQGNVLENINSKNGLLNNTVRGLCIDLYGNLWMGLDNGISFLDKNKNAIKHINPSSFNNGSGYGVTSYQGNIYFALSTGLQYIPLVSNSNLSAIPSEPKKILNGQTWNLTVINNQILAARDDGFWKINNTHANCVSNSSGYWIYKPISYDSRMLIAAGNYYGVKLYQEQNGSISILEQFKEFSESSRYLETDKKYIWVSHPYRGVFKINVADHAITLYNELNGLPTNLDNHVFKLKDQIVFATPKGIYEYDEGKDRMVPAKLYLDLFGKLPVRYLKEDDLGNIWFVQDKMVGVADYSGPQPTIHYIQELKNRILSGFENIYPLNAQNVFVGSENGFYLVNYEKYKQSIHPFKAFLTKVQIISSSDSILFGGFGLLKKEANRSVSLPYKWNSLHFSFAISFFSQQNTTEFSWFLEGFEKTWGNWSIQQGKDYTNLPEGKYTFRIKARISPTHESEECFYTFTINPPWYRTWLAKILYTLLFAAILYGFYKYQVMNQSRKQGARRLADQKEFEEKQRQLEYLHQLELEKSEKELMRLRNDNLKGEIELKNSELANTAMNLVQKKEFLLKLTDELNKLNKSSKQDIEAIELKRILRSLGTEEKLDEEWKEFSIHFNNVHNNFLITLKDRHPHLNGHELKLCAYLRMNLTSKEIARLMSISVRGVEISRYRLRKKLQLQPREDLFRYLLSLDSTNNA